LITKTQTSQFIALELKNRLRLKEWNNKGKIPATS